mmetsp:Transcript_24668/g.44609  ORF Transcript_24668/g.44609 Transcript_24668/m.44609 type:complete len:584 (+) Transcript_24668:470-2221(+)
MRLVPHCSGEDDLDLLSSRKGRQSIVGSEFTIQTTILQMLFNILGRKRADVKTSTLGNLHIDSFHSLVPSHFLKGLLRQVLSRVDTGSGITNLVFVFLALVGLTTSDKLSNNLLDLANLTTFLVRELDLERSLLELLLFGSELHRNLDKTFLVFTVVGVTPSNVLIGSLGEVTLNVMESMLCHIRNTCVGVFPYVTLLGFDFTNKELNHGRLSCAVLTDAGNTRAQRDLDGNIKQGWRLVDWVRKGAVAHLHESLTLRLDSLDWTRLRELEGILLGTGKSEVGSSMWVKLDVLVEVALELIKFQVGNSENVGTTVIEQARIVTDNDTGNVGEGVEVCLDPGNINNVQVVGRFVKQQDISLLKHCTSKSELHTPSTTERRDSVIWLGLSVFGETNRGEDLADFVLVNVESLNLLVDKDVLDTRQVRLFTLDIGFDKDGADLRNVRESLDLVVGNGSHQRRLSGIISSKKTVSLSTLEPHLGIVQKNLGSVGKGKLAVAQFLGIVFVVFLFGNHHHVFSSNANLFSILFTCLSIVVSLELDGNILRPLRILHEMKVHHGRGDLRSKRNHCLQTNTVQISTKGFFE